MLMQKSFKFEVWVDEKYHFGFVLDGNRVSLIEAGSQGELEALITAHFSSFGV